MGTTLSRNMVLVGVLAFAFFSAATAWADDVESGAIAERLFRKAQAEMNAGKINEACNDFAASLQLDRAVGTLLNLAVCHEKQGKNATAWNEYSEVISVAARAGQKDRVDFATQRAKVLEAKLIFITISMSQPIPGLEVKLNGKVLPAATLGTELPVDPGDYTVVASAPHKAEWSSMVKASPEVGNSRVTIPVLQDRKDIAIDDSGKLSLKQPFYRTRTAAIVGWASGGALVAGGVVCTILSRNRYNSLNNGSAASADASSIRSSGKRWQVAAGVLYGVGVAAAATGTAIWLTGTGQSATSTQLSLAPISGGGAVVFSGVLP